jgi:hypothetical protein
MQFDMLGIADTFGYVWSPWLLSHRNQNVQEILKFLCDTIV